MCLKMSDDKKEISPVSGGMRQILDQNSKLRAQLRDMETEKKQRETEFESRLEEIKVAHEAELQRVRESMHELNEVHRKLQDTEARVEALESEKAALQSKLESTRAAVQTQAQALAAEKQTSIKLGESLTARKTELKAAREEIEEHLERITSLKPAAVENAKLKGRIAILEKDLRKEVEAKEAKSAECEALKQGGTLQRCEKLEAENTAMRSLVEHHEKVAAEALKAKEEAEQQAFESRTKLLDLYADGEAKDIFKDSLDEAQATIKTQTAQIEELQAELAQARQDLIDVKDKVLYSSKRENLRDSLSALAKRRSLGDSDG